MELMIRPAQAEDASNLLALLSQLQGESTTFMVAQDYEEIDGLTQAENIDFLQTTTNNVILVVASDTGELFGLISAAALPGRPRQAEIGVAVLQAYQGMGLAQALVEELLNWATSFSTVDVLRLTVQAHNQAAIHIYEKFGFVRDEAENHNVLNNVGDTVAAFDMVLQLEKLAKEE